MKNFYIYIRSENGSHGEEGDRFDLLDAAIERAKIDAANCRDMEIAAQVHVIDATTGEFVFTA